MSPAILIAIASYRRPSLLARLLDSLQHSIATAGAAGDVELLVVDNDPEGSARPVVEQHPIGARWVREPAPGIAEARNRALEEFDERYAAIVLIDDDEWVDEDWFARLTGHAASSGADVVTGPQLWELPEGAPAWAAAGEWFQVSVSPTGSRGESAASNNTLLTREAWLRGGAPRFDPAFSATGSSDWDFFWGLRKTGAVIEYCAEAVAREEVASERLSRGYMARRWVSTGANRFRIHRKHGDPVAWPLLRAVLVAGKHALLVAVDLLRGRGVRGSRIKGIAQSWGWWAGAFGYRPGRYRRPAPVAASATEAGASPSPSEEGRRA